MQVLPVAWSVYALDALDVLLHLLGHWRALRNARPHDIEAEDAVPTLLVTHGVVETVVPFLGGQDVRG